MPVGDELKCGDRSFFRVATELRSVIEKTLRFSSWQCRDGSAFARGIGTGELKTAKRKQNIDPNNSEE